jgi:hypothetical protein
MRSGDHGDELRLVKLSVVEENGSIVIGNPQSGVFVAVPPVGGVVIRALQAGTDLATAEAEARRFAGQPVDVAGFVSRLRGLGFVADEASTQQEPRHTAPIQQRHWLHGPARKKIAWLFGPAAWGSFAAMAVFDIGVLIAYPQLIPHPRAAYQLVHAGAGPSLVLLFPFATALVALHECGHWLAAHAAGLQARFGIDHRMYFLVFETDLSQLWSLRRRQRYGPLLAGMAFDACMLAALLTVELGATNLWWTMPTFAAQLVAALAFTETAAITWQCLLFLRTDLYAVLATATGCHNLWQVKTLMLRRALGILSPAQAAELATARPRDLKVATWFRWLWLGGLVAAAAWFAWFSLPLLAHVVAWAVPGLTTSPSTGKFWISLCCTAILAWRYGAPAAFTIRRAAATSLARHPRSHPARDRH